MAVEKRRALGAVIVVALTIALWTAGFVAVLAFAPRSAP